MMFITLKNHAADGSEVDPSTFPLTTAEEIRVARAELRDRGLDSAPVWAGEPGCSDAYQTNGKLFAAEHVETVLARGLERWARA